MPETMPYAHQKQFLFLLGTQEDYISQFPLQLVVGRESWMPSSGMQAKFCVPLLGPDTALPPAAQTVTPLCPLFSNLGTT